MENWYSTLLVVSLVGMGFLWMSTYFPKIMFLEKFRILLATIFISMTVWTSFQLGATSNETKWKLAVADLKIKLAHAQARAEYANAQIETVFVDRIRTVRDTQVVVEERIRDIAVTVDEQCVINSQVVEIHNLSATRPAGSNQ